MFLASSGWGRIATQRPTNAQDGHTPENDPVPDGGSAEVCRPRSGDGRWGPWASWGGGDRERLAGHTAVSRGHARTRPHAGACLDVVGSPVLLFCARMGILIMAREHDVCTQTANLT